MNLVKLYMQKVIWRNVHSVDVYTRKQKEIQEEVKKFMGAPETISGDKIFAITIKFKDHLDPKILGRLLYGEYEQIHLICSCKEIKIKDAAIVFKRIENKNFLIEMNSSEIYICDWLVKEQ